MATLLAQHHSVVAVDLVAEKVEKINRWESPIADEYVLNYFCGEGVESCGDIGWCGSVS